METKRVIIHKQLDKIANNMLSDVTVNYDDQDKISRCSAINSKKDIHWNDQDFWNMHIISNPKNKLRDTSLPGFLDCNMPPPFNYNKLIVNNQPVRQWSTIHNKEKCVIQKYFQQWKHFTKIRKKKLEQLNKQIEQENKIENFMHVIKKYKRVQQKQSKLKIPKQVVKKAESVSENSLNINTKTNDNLPINEKFETDCFKNRFKAQQNIIQMQKEKLVKQEKLIENLKLGKIQEEIEESICNTTMLIKQTLRTCSHKVKCKIKPNLIDDSLQLHLISNKAPKIIQEMEKRAIERAQKRQIIFERKLNIDQEKKRMIELEIQRKQTQDKEERINKLQELKERQRREVELQRQRQLKQEQYIKTLIVADNFYKQKCLRFGLNCFIKLIEMREINMRRSHEFYNQLLQSHSIYNWLFITQKSNKIRFYKVDNFYKKNLLKHFFHKWHSFYVTCVQSLQAADDIYEFRLQSKMFIYWHRYTCIQYVLDDKATKNAQKHYQRRILWHYFYQWKSLPVVIKLERAKEEKKQKWREKVWEVLPDYKPFVDE